MKHIKRCIKLSILILVVILISTNSYKVNAAIVNSDWSKLYGSNQRDAFEKVLKTSDGGFISAGYTYSTVGLATSNGYVDGLIVKTFADGSVDWVKQYGGSDRDQITSITDTADGGYIVSGYTYGNVGSTTNIGAVDGWIMKITSTGTIEWSKQYGSTEDDQLNSITTTDDGGYIAVGYTAGNVGSSTNLGVWDGWAIKVSADGTEEWSRQFGSTNNDEFYDIKKTVNGYIIAGGYYLDSNSGQNGWIFKLTSGGIEEWSKNYGNNTGGKNDALYSIITTPDGGYAATGVTYGSVGSTTNIGQSDGWVIKVSSNGTEEWSKQYGSVNYDGFESIKLTDHGEYIVVGYSNGDGAVLKLRENGEQNWFNLISSVNPDSAGDYFNDIEIIGSGNYIIAGYTFGGTETNTNSGNYDAWMVRITEKYELSFDNNGSVDPSPTTQTIIVGQKGIKPINPVKEGYTFVSWNTKQDGSGINWDFTNMTMPSYNITLFAQWKKDSIVVDKYTLKFDLNGGQGQTPKNQMLELGKKAIKPTDPIKDGYTFIGWNTKKDGSGSSWNFNKDVMPANNVTLYAQWSKNKIPDTGYNNDVIILSTILILSAVTLVTIYRRNV